MDERTELETWEAPQVLKEYFPYYLAGYDHENRPIWIAEIGRWNFRKIVEGGREYLENFEKFVDQAFHRLIQSIQVKQSNQDSCGSAGAIFIFDFDAYSLLQMTHMPTVCFLTRLAKAYLEKINKFIHKVFLLNANGVTRLLVNVMRPIVGGLMERVHVYGTTQSKWTLFKFCPAHSIPQCYGGYPNFIPLKVYGLTLDSRVTPPLLLNRNISITKH